METRAWFVSLSVSFFSYVDHQTRCSSNCLTHEKQNIKNFKQFAIKCYSSWPIGGAVALLWLSEEVRFNVQPP